MVGETELAEAVRAFWGGQGSAISDGDLDGLVDEIKERSFKRTNV